MTELERRYSGRQVELRTQILAILNRTYSDSITPDDLDSAFEVFTPRAAVILRAGQARGISLASAYLTALITLESGRRPDLGAFTGAEIVGTTAAGASLIAGMAAFPSMVKAQIGKGLDIPEAVEYGRFLTERFGDAEVTSAVDRHTDAVTSGSGQFTGWEGIVSGASCAPCGDNAGLHSLDEDIYRHGSCNCVKQYVVAQ